MPLCKHILSSGHKLVATARSPSSLSYLPSSPRLLTLAFDATSPSAIKTVFAAAIKKFGRIDVVVNNAGYGLLGDTEAAVDEDARKLLDMNFWGTVDVSKEAVRVMREVNAKDGGGIGGCGCSDYQYERVGFQEVRFAMQGLWTFSSKILPQFQVQL